LWRLWQSAVRRSRRGRSAFMICTPMTEEIESHIAAIEAFYRPLIRQPRLIGAERLWGQFEQAVVAFREHGRRQVNGVIERVNEVVVARQLLADPTLPLARIEYEPEIVTDGPRFDFAVDVEPHLYVEVKTVEPKTEDNDRNWNKVVQRQEHVSPGTHYIVANEWMGATL